MRTLSATLLAAQKAHARKPYVTATLQLYEAAGRPPRPRWTRYYTGAENDDPIAAAVTTDGSLVRVRANGTTIEYATVTDPGAGSTYSTWSTLEAGATDGPVAVCAGPAGEVIALYTTTSGTVLRHRTSADNGQTWSAAATILTEGSAIAALTATFGSGSDAAAFYALAASATVKHVRRTSGTWAGSGTTWSKSADFTAVNGISATWNGDFEVAVTGTLATTAHPVVYTTLMGDVLLPTDVWGGFIEVQRADAAGGVTYSQPSIVRSGFGVTLLFLQRESADVAADRVMLTHSHRSTNAHAWLEPYPTEAGHVAGAAIAHQAENFWMVQSDGVWHFDASQNLDVSARLQLLDLAFGAETCRGTLELDDTDGSLEGATAYAGGGCVLTLGYATSAGNESGHVIHLRIDRAERTVDRGRGRRYVALALSGPWEAAARHHNPQAYQVAAGTLSRDLLFQRTAARAGVVYTSGGSATNWYDIDPSFAWQPGETAAAALRRLASVAEEAIRHDEGQFRVITLPAASSYDYGPSDHPTTAFTTIIAAAPASWVRLQGIDRYADAFDTAELDAFGAEVRHIRNLEASSDAVAQDYADAALDRAIRLKPAAALTAPANVGQELWDVVTVAEPDLGIDQDYRVTGLRYVLERRPTRPARYDIQLELGAV